MNPLHGVERGWANEETSLAKLYIRESVTWSERLGYHYC
jgi:hypothetical protein